MNASAGWKVTLYESGDRAAVREICCDTADKGRPVERFFHDRELFADLLTRYYTDYESRSLWVAKANGRVVGYLTGCLDTARYQRIFRWRILPGVILRALARGILLRRETWRLIQAAVMTWRRGGFRRKVRMHSYPAHLHINIRTEFRGHHVGQWLIEQFLEQVRARGLRGIHLVTRGDNQTACRFFERMGFQLLSRHPGVLPSRNAWERHDAVVYGKPM